MRRFDDSPLEPDIAAALQALDATLDGDPVDPKHAELAELALLLAVEPPRPRPEFAAALDQRVAARFVAPAGAARRSRRRGLYAPGAMAAAAAAVAVVVVLGSGGAPKQLATDLSAPASQVANGSAASSPGGNVEASSSSSAGTSTAAAASSTNAPQAPTSGRQVVQSAQLALSARPSQIDDVAQQVFNVVASEKGVVNNSNVTATRGSDGYATFQLSVPSASLSETMSALSRLQGARVVSRTDASQDITGQVGGSGRRLADARALRRSLLKQLAGATTTEQVDSLKLQIRDVEASISSDLATLDKLHRQVDFSSISVTVNAAPSPVAPASHGGGFTLGRATHDAGRVLVVAAGVALIALAVLVPVGLAAALAAWIGLAVRRRRREHALDLL
jgi:hypothetical protein